jgi:hypothetical protein
MILITRPSWKHYALQKVDLFPEVQRVSVNVTHIA